MSLTQRPFGVAQQAFVAELERRQQEYARHIAGRQRRLGRLRQANAIRRRYLSLLSQEVEHLYAEKAELLARLQVDDLDDASAHETHVGSPGIEPLTLGQLQHLRERNRTLHRRLLSDVMALLAPYLTSTHHTGHREV